MMLVTWFLWISQRQPWICWGDGHKAHFYCQLPSLNPIFLIAKKKLLLLPNDHFYDPPHARHFIHAAVICAISVHCVFLVHIFKRLSNLIVIRNRDYNNTTIYTNFKWLSSRWSLDRKTSLLKYVLSTCK